MKIINDFNNIPNSAKGSVIALGNFDGVHKGHIEVINTAINIAKSNDTTSAVMTFEPHPINLFNPSIKNYRLTSEEQKAQILEKLGIDYLYTVNFNNDFSKITAHEFILDILLKKLGASHIVTGYDYIFGHNKGGNADMLQEYARKHSFGYTKVEAVGDISRYSSTRVRNALKEADISQTNSILGRNYSISGKIVEGDNRGKSIGFPTINVDMGEYIRPKYGVYAVSVTIKGNNTIYQGVANIGVKPTFNGSEETLEVHIFDFEQNVYGLTAEIQLLKYIRQERKFKDANELVGQIKQDCISARS